MNGRSLRVLSGEMPFTFFFRPIPLFQMKLVRLCSIYLTMALLLANAPSVFGSDALNQGWANPPRSARLRAYWWWLNGNVTKASITRDLEEMKAKGFGGALICDAGGAEQDGNAQVPHGPTFFSPAWRELYKHALHEADRLGLEMSLNILSGWNLGGPIVSQADAAKKLVWTQLRVSSVQSNEFQLPQPKARDNYYQDLFVVAYPAKSMGGAVGHRPLQNWEEKAVYRTLHFSAPDTSPLFQQFPEIPGEEDTHRDQVVDLSAYLETNGVLHWHPPAGEWEVLRFGFTIGDNARVSTSSEGWRGYALDVLDAGAFERYWNAVVEPLIADAGPLVGKTLRYLHTDSWEVEAVNWTPTMRAEFRKRRGYDFLPFLPVLAGRIVDSREISDRFLADYRKTIGDLAIDHHYRIFRDSAHRHGLLIHPESGGPHAVPIDAQRCLGWDDAPMSEFWAWSWRHRIGDTNRFFVKQPASAAHTYGHPLVVAEGFTSMGPHWQETIWDNLKPSFDRALCEGLNLLVWHAFVCSPQEMGVPGQQYFAGTHFNPNSTWWPMSGAFLGYIDRCQFMLQQGVFAADACYYYGDHVPNFAQLKRSDPAHVLPSYDYDVLTEEALLTRLSVKNGQLVLPGGMSYRVLVLPERTVISLPVLRKIKRLVADGATVVGPKPDRASGLQDFPRCDAEVRALAGELWGMDGTARLGKGRVIAERTARDILLSNGVPPDFEYEFVERPMNQAIQMSHQGVSNAAPATLDYVHRTDGKTGIYFVANPANGWECARCTFRVADKAPEIWDPVSGGHRFAAAYQQTSGRTTVPLEFPPCGSLFIIFREPSAKHPAAAAENWPALSTVQEIRGSWNVSFDPHWGGPETVRFDELVSWPTRPEAGIKYYSGTAAYRKDFDLNLEKDRLPMAGRKRRIFLDLGVVYELAQVRLNGHDLGVVWAPPFRVDITDVVKPGGNLLEVDVVNFWPNRIIGDQFLPEDKRYTRTNIRRLTKENALMESGLLGPVCIELEN